MLGLKGVVRLVATHFDSQPGVTVWPQTDNSVVISFGPVAGSVRVLSNGEVTRVRSTTAWHLVSEVELVVDEYI